MRSYVCEYLQFYSVNQTQTQGSFAFRFNSFRSLILFIVNIYSCFLLQVTNTLEFAKTWGRMKSNRSEEMNYEKMSRAMRYHYGCERQGRKGHLAMVKEKRLYYKWVVAANCFCAIAISCEIVARQQTTEVAVCSVCSVISGKCHNIICCIKIG